MFAWHHASAAHSTTGSTDWNSTTIDDQTQMEDFMKRPALGSRTRRTTSAPDSARFLRIFGPPPLLEGEDPAIYKELMAQVSAILKPLDILEQMWVRDIGDLEWEIRRYRRLNTNLMATKKFGNAWHTLCNEVRECFPDYDNIGFKRLVFDWLNQDVSKQVNETFASVGLTMDAVMAVTLRENLDAIARIDGMIAMAEVRRNAALREFERHRATLGWAPRRAVEQVDDTRFEMIETKPVEKKGAA
jgi:hypothetical protein